ncbi:MAG: GNAT family N-acetyltransferase [Candidatus Rariloculaceae bacterium]
MTIEVRIADFEKEQEFLRLIRFMVFVEEQQVPAEMEMDDEDLVCIHVLALYEGEPVGTGRIDIGKAGKIGRVAVLSSRRRQGVGEAVMTLLHDLARQNALAGVWCNAQVSAVPFYENLGYRVTSAEPFDEAGIPHLRMEYDCSS